jgi:hypothetical protein
MINLARHDYNKEADEKVKEELIKADIPFLNVGIRNNLEVKTNYIGILNGFVFYRAWTYWVVSGYLPLKYAKEIYLKYKILNIRCAGHCGNPPPEEWCKPKNIHEQCKPIIDKFFNKEISEDECNKLCKEIRTKGDQFIDTYHIDTQDGLNQIADIIKQNNITTEFIN